MSGISCSVTLSNAFLVEIDSLFKEKYNLLLPKIDKSKLESLCQFALTLENNHFPVLKNDIISYVNNINIEGDNIDELFIKAVLLTFNTKEDCGLLNTFILSLFKKNGIYKDIDYSQEQKEILISNDLIQHYIEHIIIGENNETTDLLWVFQHKENIEILKSHIEMISNGDPAQVYLQKMQEAAMRTDGGSQLGLARIRYESNASISLAVEDDLVRVTVIFDLK